MLTGWWICFVGWRACGRFGPVWPAVGTLPGTLGVSVYIAYVDDSGNNAFPPRGSMSYSLGCVLVESRRWPDVFDELIEYRRFIKANFGVPIRAEVKANYLLRNGGPHFRAHPISEGARHRIYRGFLRLLHKLELNVFGIVVKKDRMQALGITRDPREMAWEWLLQRLERFSTKGGTEVLLMHDEGESRVIRKATRRARRAGTAGSAFGGTSLRRPARLIVDDPVPRQSDQSYFVQVADLAAYAAFRHEYPPPARPVQIVPQAMWLELGDARFAPVSALAGGPRGLVVGP